MKLRYKPEIDDSYWFAFYVGDFRHNESGPAFVCDTGNIYQLGDRVNIVEESTTWWELLNAEKIRAANPP